MFRQSLYILAWVGGVALMAGSAQAATMFTDDFTGGAASGKWENPTDADYTNDRAQFTDVWPGSGVFPREYLRTADDDYAGTDFVATVRLGVDYDLPDNVYFGLGNGTPNEENWGEANPEAIYFYLHPGSSTSDTVLSETTGTTGYGGWSSLTAPFDVQLTWDASTRVATFALDTDLDGIFGETTDGGPSGGSKTVTAPEGFFTSGSHLYFGGCHNVWGDDFSVVPEPSSLSLLAIGLVGLLAYAWRRRR